MKRGILVFIPLWCHKNNFRDKEFLLFLHCFFYTRNYLSPKFWKWHLSKDKEFLSNQRIMYTNTAHYCFAWYIVYKNSQQTRWNYICINIRIPSGDRNMKPGLVLLETLRSNFEFFLTSPKARLKRIQNWILKSLVKIKIPVSVYIS